MSMFAPAKGVEGEAGSRRQAIAVLLGSPSWLAAANDGPGGPPIRLAISESLMGEVNLSDARAAMLVWVKIITREMNLAVDYSPRVFDTTQEIVNRAREGRLDAVALNVVEYRQIADLFDSSQIVTGAGHDQYVILVKQQSGFERLGDLRGRRLIMLKNPKTCVGPAWLSTILDEQNLGPSDQFFGSVVTDPKITRAVLPVFFGQAEACLTSRGAFETMCELNPQLAKDMKSLAISPAIVVGFYVFRKNFQGPVRERLLKVFLGLKASQSGRQVATLFQFEDLVIRDGSCLAPALALLERSDRIRSRAAAGSRKR